MSDLADTVYNLGREIDAYERGALGLERDLDREVEKVHKLRRELAAAIVERDLALAELEEWRTAPPEVLQGRIEAELRAQIRHLEAELAARDTR